MEKKVEVSMLWQLYGKLLTEKQYEFIDDHYNNDLSLSEIAENNKITRQAVRDIIKKGRKNFSIRRKVIIYEKDVKSREKNRKGLIGINKNTKRLFRQRNCKCTRKCKKRIKLFSLEIYKKKN